MADPSPDPPPVLPYRTVPRPARQLPGDEMAFAAGCFTSVVGGLPACCLLAAAFNSGDWRPLAGGLAMVATQVGIGYALGVRGGRWGYLRAVAWAILGWTGVLLVMLLALRR